MLSKTLLFWINIITYYCVGMEKDRWDKEESQGHYAIETKKRWDLIEEDGKIEIKRGRRVDEIGLKQNGEGVIKN